MKQKFELKISGRHYSELKKHLFNGDGKESVSIALCGRHQHNGTELLLVNELVHIPYDICEVRTPYRVTWSTDPIIPALDKAEKYNLGVVKFHSHPTGYNDFSDIDDVSDKGLFKSIYSMMNHARPHASAVMLPNGELFGRVITEDGNFQALNKISVIGNDLLFWQPFLSKPNEAIELRTIQAFGEGTVQKLRSLKIGVVGCSGTGSPTIEQLIRLGVGELILVDPDIIEKKNLNRIINSTLAHAEAGTPKVNVFREAASRIGFKTKVKTFADNLYGNREAINEIALCDVIFGCTDSIDGRHLLNQIATFYLVAYFDMGVKLTSNKKGGISKISAAVHYIQPGGSSLLTRGVYTTEQYRAATLLRANPEGYRERKKLGYIEDVEVESPAVISINMQTASTAVNEFLARLHPYRYDSNDQYAITILDFSNNQMFVEPDGESDVYLKKFVGRGIVSPLLNMTDLE